MASTDLKQLGFINTYSSLGYDYVSNSKYTAKACSIYNYTKESSRLKPGFEKLESAIKFYGTPLLNKATELAPVYLAKADEKVDKTVDIVKKTYEESVLPSTPVKAALAVKEAFYAKHPENLELFKNARDEYFQLIENSIETLKSRGVALSADALNSVKEAIKSARASAQSVAPNQKVIFEKASASWEKLAATPAVASVLEKTLPKIQVAKEKALVFLSAVQENPTYKSYAEPTVNRLSSSPYVTKVLGYVKPLMVGPVCTE